MTGGELGLLRVTASMHLVADLDEEIAIREIGVLLQSLDERLTVSACMPHST